MLRVQNLLLQNVTVGRWYMSRPTCLYGVRNILNWLLVQEKLMTDGRKPFYRGISISKGNLPLLRCLLSAPRGMADSTQLETQPNREGMKRKHTENVNHVC